MDRYLFVIDYQNAFVVGALGFQVKVLNRK